MMDTIRKEKSRVALVPCKTYQEEQTGRAIRDGMALLGGFPAFFRPEEKILLKPNLLRAAPPDRAVTTHPAVFSATAKLLCAEGYGHLFWGDSPGGGTAPHKAADMAGIAKAAEILGIKPADFTTAVSVPFPKGRRAKSFQVCKGALDAGGILSLSKMKTHGLTRITGAVKNLYGCVCGLHKGTGHVKHPDPGSFAKMLADLNVLLAPRLHIMDGIVAMEGNGPASGRPVSMGVLLFSGDPVALDSVFCSLVHLDPALVPTNVRGGEAGVGQWRFEEIEVATAEGMLTPEEAGEKYGRTDFDVYRSREGAVRLLHGAEKPRGRLPHIAEDRCIRCGVCVESCPLADKAVAMSADKTQPPRYDYEKCIRCYCCQEMCPAQAIEVRDFSS